MLLSLHSEEKKILKRTIVYTKFHKFERPRFKFKHLIETINFNARYTTKMIQQIVYLFLKIEIRNN